MFNRIRSRNRKVERALHRILNLTSSASWLIVSRVEIDVPPQEIDD
jgi:hypothetical protein